jgi:hypothetical protein
VNPATGKPFYSYLTPGKHWVTSTELREGWQLCTGALGHGAGQQTAGLLQLIWCFVCAAAYLWPGPAWGAPSTLIWQHYGVVLASRCYAEVLLLACPARASMPTVLRCWCCADMLMLVLC